VLCLVLCFPLFCVRSVPRALAVFFNLEHNVALEAEQQNLSRLLRGTPGHTRERL